MNQLFSVVQVGNILSISPWTVRALLRKGRLCPIRIGRRILVSGEAVQRFIEESTTHNNSRCPVPENDVTTESQSISTKHC